MTAIPEWLHVGSELAVVTETTVSPVKVVKIGKRDIVLDDGTRFTLNNRWGDEFVRYVGDGAWRRPEAYLVPRDHRRAVTVAAKQRQKRAQHKVRVVYETLDSEWRHSRTVDVAMVRALIAAAEGYIQFLEEA